MSVFGSHTLWMFHNLNPCMDFHQTFSSCLIQVNLELIILGEYMAIPVAMAMLLRLFDLKLDLPKSQCCCPFSDTCGLGFLPTEAGYFLCSGTSIDPSDFTTLLSPDDSIFI